MDVSSTSQSPPDACLLQTKRRCPFGESQRDFKIPAIKNKIDAVPHVPLEYPRENHNFGETAFEILMNTRQSQLPSALNNTLFFKCWVCEHLTETLPCTFCERGVCEMCVRQCDKCCGVFCSLCATVKYDHHEDHALCLTCNAEDIKKRRDKIAL